MDFLIEIFWALLMVGLPIGVFTLVLVWWSLQRGLFKESLDTRALEREIKALSGNKKQKDKKHIDERHPLQKKWAKFGGGFYGVVAFFTYIVVEAGELFTMVANFGGFMDFIRRLDFDVIIRVFVEALTNFITAMIWPVYWMQRIDTKQTWIWFLVAYGGYWAGLKLAQLLMRYRSQSVA